MATRLIPAKEKMGIKSFLIIFSSICIFTLSLIPRSAYSIPFVVFHGISDKCSNEGVTRFTNLLSNWSGSQGYCIEIGNGAWDSWTLPFLKQTAIACEKVKEMSELRKGYNIIGLSQGNMVGRGILEFCDRPRAFEELYISGRSTCRDSFCSPLRISCGVHSSRLSAPVGNLQQLCSGPSLSYCDIDEYEKGCKFLPRLNNEIHKNLTYKGRFASLRNLVLIMFEKDTILVPKETSWFGYFPNGSWSAVLPAQETTLYAEDRIGLKSLDEAGKVKFIKVPGAHLEVSYSDMEEYILPFLEENTTTTRLRLSSESSRSCIWRSSEPKGEMLKL